MKKNDLIAALQAIEGNPEVCILDYQTNYQADSGDGSSEGVHHFTVQLLGKEDIPDSQEPWIALSFDDPDVSNEGEPDPEYPDINDEFCINPLNKYPYGYK